MYTYIVRCLFKAILIEMCCNSQ